MAITPGSIEAGVGIGEIFVDKYRVDGILGHGGMGVVARCTHLALNEQVAIKMLRRDVLDDADAVERFMREAQAAVKLKSEYVARVTDVGRSRNNVPYMVMEYLEGHDLGFLLDERKTIGQPWAVEITLQCCEALAEAHSLGIVHRDVKPTNLFVTWRPDGSALIKVLDFGISKALTGNAMALTQTQSLLGTPAYMSPEQMRSARMVDARTDIWSLGTVLFEMLEGRRPFEAESFSEMCVKVAVDPPGTMKNTPLQLQQVVLRCLEKAPEQRYASMAELARDLVPFSHDPHQAQVLVERMARTLRRSQVQPVEWNPSSSGVSGPVRPLRSSAEHAAESSGGIERAIERADRAGERTTPRAGEPAAVEAVGSGRMAAAAAAAPALGGRNTASRPALSETMAVSRPRIKATRIVGVVGAVSATFIAALWLSRPAAKPSEAPRAQPAAAANPQEATATGAAAAAAATPTAPAAVAAPLADPTAIPRPPAPPPASGGADEAAAAAAAAAAGSGSNRADTAPTPARGAPIAPAQLRRPGQTGPGSKGQGATYDPPGPPKTKKCVFDGAHPTPCSDGDTDRGSAAPRR